MSVLLLLLYQHGKNDTIGYNIIYTIIFMFQKTFKKLLNPSLRLTIDNYKKNSVEICDITYMHRMEGD